MTGSSRKVILKVGFLTTINEPLLPAFLDAALANGISDITAICDSRTVSERDKALWQERTGGALDSHPNARGIYGFASAAIPFYFVGSHNDDETLDLIGRLGINCLINAGTPRRVSGRLLSSVKHGVLNVHPGILPRYRGCSAVEWAIFNDDRVGNTAHFMDEGYDTGPIIATERYQFPRDADYRSIRIHVYRAGCLLAGKALRLIEDRAMTPRDAPPQDASQGKYWEPIPDDKMAEVLRKISAGSYRYQDG
jgi:methionyl-tRNA formyltransferase